MKKKTFITVLALSLAVVIIGVFIFSYSKMNKKNTEGTSPSTDKTDNLSEITDKTDEIEDQQKENNIETSLESLNGLNYMILRNEVIQNTNTDKKDFYFDILTTTSLSDEDIISLGKSIIKIKEENYDILNTSFNTFTNKDAFITTLEESYSGEAINGLETSFRAAAGVEGKSVNYTRYISFQDNDVITPQLLDYKFVQNKVSENGHATSFIILPEQPINETWSLFQIFTEEIKDLNNGISNVTLNSYLTEDDYDQNKEEYIFESKTPSFIMKIIEFNY